MNRVSVTQNIYFFQFVENTYCFSLWKTKVKQSAIFSSLVTSKSEINEFCNAKNREFRTILLMLITKGIMGLFYLNFWTSHILISTQIFKFWINNSNLLLI